MLSRDEIEQRAELVSTLVADGDFDSAEGLVNELAKSVEGGSDGWHREIMAQCLERKAMFAQRRNNPQLAYDLLARSEGMSPSSSSATINMVTALMAIPGVSKMQVLKATQQAIAKLESLCDANPNHLALAYHYYAATIEDMVVDLFNKGEDRELLEKKVHSVTLTYHSSLEYASSANAGPVRLLLSKACERWSAWLVSHSTQLPFPTTSFGPSWASQVACAQNFDASLEAQQPEAPAQPEPQLHSPQQEQCKEPESRQQHQQHHQGYQVQPERPPQQRERYRPLLQGRESL